MISQITLNNENLLVTQNADNCLHSENIYTANLTDVTTTIAQMFISHLR